MWKWMCISAVVLLDLGVKSGVGRVGSQMLGRNAYVSVPQLITDAGYPVERHRARTSDGYVLQMHRIPAGRRAPRRSDDGQTKGKRPVLLVHGLFGSSSDFVIMGPKRSLAYLLADSGYDVWLGNLRGTTYSAHANYTRNDSRFWQFSFAEHGTYDVPAFIDTVLSKTGLPKLLYIGYSMGTTSFFVMASERPEYNEKVVAFVALAPAVYLDNVRSLVEFALINVQWPDTMRSSGVHSLSLRRELRDLVAGAVCRARRRQDDVCMRLVYSIVGEDYEQNDWDMMPVVLARFQPASLRQLEHFGKIALTGEFLSWGAGMKDLSAPAYDVTRVRVPVHLIYGENDQLTEKSQVLRLATALHLPTNDSAAHSVPWRKFNHLDFVFARDLDRLLTKNLVALVDRLYSRHGADGTSYNISDPFPSSNFDGKLVTRKSDS